MWPKRKKGEIGGDCEKNNDNTCELADVVSYADKRLLYAH